MPNLRQPCATRQCTFKLLRGLAFKDDSVVGRIVDVPTIIPQNESCLAPRFPSVEVVMGAERLYQESWVELPEGPKIRRYFVASYYDRRSPVNRALKVLVPDLEWRGELIIMRGGQTVFVTELGSRRTAERAVRTYLVECLAAIRPALRRGQPIEIPSFL